MRYYILLTLTGFSLMTGHSALADPGCCKPDIKCTTPCTTCSKILTCCPASEVVKEKKKCYEVECDYICVPEVKCPWGKFLCFGRLRQSEKSDCCSSCGATEACACAGRCGKIKKINKLKTVSYECEKTVWKWEVKERNAIGYCKPDCSAPHSR